MATSKRVASLAATIRRERATIRSMRVAADRMVAEFSADYPDVIELADKIRLQADEISQDLNEFVAQFGGRR